LKTLLLLLDVGTSTGLGHWYRCQALTAALPTHLRVIWVTPAIPENLRADLLAMNQAWKEVPGWSMDQMHSILADPSLQPDGFILDLIATPVALVRGLREISTVLSIGGAGPGRDEVDVRIDGMFPRPSFHALFSGHELYLGPEFVILREVFASITPHKPPQSIKRVLITLGGDAQGKGLALALECSPHLKDLRLDVVVGPLFQKNESGEEANLRLHQAPENILTLLMSADVIVCAGGMTAYECCRLGLPMIIFPTTPLQREAAGIMVDQGVALLAESAEAVCQTLHDLRGRDIRLTFSNRGQSLVDGLGVHRVAALIATTFTK
jgi:spore coat polysaccharide biosynthesis predicted glycosyltransferase SpsG